MADLAREEPTRAIRNAATRLRMLIEIGRQRGAATPDHLSTMLEEVQIIERAEDVLGERS